MEKLEATWSLRGLLAPPGPANGSSAWWLVAGRVGLEVQRAIEWRQETLAPSDGRSILDQINV